MTRQSCMATPMHAARATGPGVLPQHGVVPGTVTRDGHAGMRVRPEDTAQ